MSSGYKLIFRVASINLNPLLSQNLNWRTVLYLKQSFFEVCNYNCDRIFWDITKHLKDIRHRNIFFIFLHKTLKPSLFWSTVYLTRKIYRFIQIWIIVNLTLPQPLIHLKLSHYNMLIYLLKIKLDKSDVQTMEY